MGLDLHPMRQLFVDAPNSLGSRLRDRRWQMFADAFPALSDMTVIDLGGSVSFWERASVRPAHVHVVNLEDQPADPPSWIEVGHADACELPPAIGSRRYDLVFSNSVIEHVGGHERRLRFAETVRSLSERYWVQTPYRYFPIEPHYVAPGMQFLPLALRARAARRWPLVHTRPSGAAEALDAVLWIELLDRTQMRTYFPEATLRAERVAGVVKSLIALVPGEDHTAEPGPTGPAVTASSTAR